MKTAELCRDKTLDLFTGWEKDTVALKYTYYVCPKEKVFSFLKLLLHTFGLLR